MKYEFLRRLFASCSAEGNDMFADGQNLHELYKDTEETRTDDIAFTKAVEGLPLEFEAKSALGFACARATDAYEMQGFINGFRIGMPLAEELKGAIYDHIEEVRSEDMAFTKIIDSLPLEIEKKNEVNSACSRMCDAYERQGLINGFRIGRLLAEELKGGVPHE